MWPNTPNSTPPKRTRVLFTFIPFNIWDFWQIIKWQASGEHLHWLLFSVRKEKKKFVIPIPTLSEAEFGISSIALTANLAYFWNAVSPIVVLISLFIHLLSICHQVISIVAIPSHHRPPTKTLIEKLLFQFDSDFYLDWIVSCCLLKIYKESGSKPKHLHDIFSKSGVNTFYFLCIFDEERGDDIWENDEERTWNIYTIIYIYCIFRICKIQLWLNNIDFDAFASQRSLHRSFNLFLRVWCNYVQAHNQRGMDAINNGEPLAAGSVLDGLHVLKIWSPLSFFTEIPRQNVLFLNIQANAALECLLFF